MYKFFRYVVLIVLCCFVFPFGLFAEEVKVVFTGQSYACLYPCHCPVSPEGGIARRASLIKTIRSSFKNVLVLEAGASVATGKEDQYSQNYSSDLSRTEIYLKSLSLMGYDALLASQQEYAFGSDFLKKHPEMPFVSSNIEGMRTYVLKNLGKIKVGILGFTDAGAAAKGVQEWKPPVKVIEGRIAELKNKGANFIILLSSLSPPEDVELLKNVKGISVVINGSASFGPVNPVVQNGIVFLTTGWQAKQVGVLSLDVVGSKVTVKGFESKRLTSDIPDDEKVSSLLPTCFKNDDCKKMAGFVAQCQQSGTPRSQCIYTASPKISVTVIKPEACRTCRIEEVLESLKKAFGELKVDYFSENASAARKIIQEFKITMLPAYLFHKDIENSEVFVPFSKLLEKGKDLYWFKPTYAGVSYILGRQRIVKRLDVFFSFTNASSELFALLETFIQKHPDIDTQFHYLALQKAPGDIQAKGGLVEVEEFKRCACIDQMEPQKLIAYLVCRSLKKESTWWEDCTRQAQVDAAGVSACARSEKGLDALLERIQLTKELSISRSPTFIVDNTEIFGMMTIPSLQDFEKAVLGKEDVSGPITIERK